MQTKILPLLMALGLTACAAAADSGERTLVGEIHIKGNEPFPTVMIHTTSQESWELIGMPLAEARSLAGREARVKGTVVRAPGPDVWLPSLRVMETVKPVQP